jgi:hypothetical protein
VAHEFIILNKGKLEKYDEFEKIPKSFDNVIKFLPQIPDGPHTEEQHIEIDSWNMKFKELMSRETNKRKINASSNKNR